MKNRKEIENKFLSLQNRRILRYFSLKQSIFDEFYKFTVQTKINLRTHHNIIV